MWTLKIFKIWFQGGVHSFYRFQSRLNPLFRFRSRRTSSQEFKGLVYSDRSNKLSDWLRKSTNQCPLETPFYRSKDRFLALRIEIERDPFLTEHVLEHMINRKCWYNDNRNAWCGNKMKLWWSRGVIRRQLKNLIVEIRTAPRLKIIQ